MRSDHLTKHVKRHWAAENKRKGLLINNLPHCTFSNDCNSDCVANCADCTKSVPFQVSQ